MNKVETVETFLVKKRPFELFRCSTKKTKTKKVERAGKERLEVKSSPLYLYSAFNNTNCVKATAQNLNIVSLM